MLNKSASRRLKKKKDRPSSSSWFITQLVKETRIPSGRCGYEQNVTNNPCFRRAEEEQLKKVSGGARDGLRGMVKLSWSFQGAL